MNACCIPFSHDGTSKSCDDGCGAGAGPRRTLPFRRDLLASRHQTASGRVPNWLDPEPNQLLSLVSSLIAEANPIALTAAKVQRSVAVNRQRLHWDYNSLPQQRASCLPAPPQLLT